MLKIKDNKISKGYKGFWSSKEYKYIEEFNIKLANDFEKFDITYEIDKILENEGYNIDFYNCCMSGYDDVIYYDFEDKYQKHFLRMTTEVTYTVEQLDYSEVSKYDYEITFKPEAIVPIKIKTED